MGQTVIQIVVAMTTLSAGLMAGVYFAFSGFIMRSLDQLGAVPAAAAMNAINAVILRSWFMVLFFGSTLLSAGLVAMAVLDNAINGRWWLGLMGGIYVLGMFVVTAACNVPLNNQLARVAGGDEAGTTATWDHYRHTWTRWNHLRTAASVLTLCIGVTYLVVYA